MVFRDLKWVREVRHVGRSIVLRSGLFFFCLLVPEFLVAQDTSYEDYENKNEADTSQGTEPEKIVKKNINRAYKVLNDYVEDHGEEIAEFAAEQKDKETRFGHDGPERNPLDKQDGKLGESKSWNEYKTDSKIILKEKTFGSCLEPRIIATEKGTEDPQNKVYADACEENCAEDPILDLIYGKNTEWQVYSYYWPQNQISVNKAGAQMIDPDIVGENRGQDEYYRRKTQDKEQNDDIRGKEAQVELLEKMGIPASDSEKFKDPDYHRSPREFHLRQDGELRYPSSMRPNAFWRAANARKDFLKGYDINDHCFFNGIDLPTVQKKVIANRYDQGIYAIMARYPEIRKDVDEERYKYTSPAKLQINEYKNEGQLDYQNSLCASWRMGSNNEIYGELEKVGFQQKDDKKFIDYCLPGGYDLSGSMVVAEGTPILQADAARAVMAAIWFGSESSAFGKKSSEAGKMNTSEKRIDKYTFYKERKNSSVERYVGKEKSPGENESKIVFIDKIQRIYPTQQESGDSDGKMGASSKNNRSDSGQRGSYCFRPEDIPNWSSEGDTNKSEWPLGLMGGVEDHFGETRWAIWNRRVICTCNKHGRISKKVEGSLIPVPVIPTPACLNLNDGDHDETVFIGSQRNLAEVPPALDKAIPIIRGLADKQDKPESTSKVTQNFDLNEQSQDSKAAGFVEPKLPQGTQQASGGSGQQDFPPPQVICMLAEDAQPTESEEDKKPEDSTEAEDAADAPANSTTSALDEIFGEAGFDVNNNPFNLVTPFNFGGKKRVILKRVEKVPFTENRYRVYKLSSAVDCEGSNCSSQIKNNLLPDINPFSFETCSMFRNKSGRSELVCGDLLTKSWQKDCANGQCGINSGPRGGGGGAAPASAGGGQQGQSGYFQQGENGLEYCQPTNGQGSGSCSGGTCGTQGGGNNACSGGNCGGQNAGGCAGGNCGAQGGGQGAGGGCSGGGCGGGGGSGGGGGGAGGGQGGGGGLGGILGGILGGGAGGANGGGSGGNPLPSFAPSASSSSNPSITPTATPTPAPTFGNLFNN